MRLILSDNFQQLAERAIRELKTKDLNRAASLVNQDQLQVEEAKLFWARSEPKIAINIMKNLISKLGQVSCCNRRQILI